MLGIHYDCLAEASVRRMVNILKFIKHNFLLNFCFFVQLFLKILSGMANSTNLDQNDPEGAV